MTKAGSSFDVYDHERKALAEIKRVLTARHSFRGVMTVDQEEAIQRAFTKEAVERCAEIGLIVDVVWHWETWHCPACRGKFETQTTICPTCGAETVRTGSPDVSDDPNDNNLYWNPAIVITDRIEHLVHGYDHDRQKYEVQSGLLTGKKGGIRESGEFREDLRKQFFSMVPEPKRDPVPPSTEGSTSVSTDESAAD